ncbi:IST1-like protein isoform X1 [Zingiber officinale]|uniref:IST1-like protein isoform X1 n=1 Tax=Zingiber officinale TaxID=94328 RepID=UPI001C4CEC01|nr:IST1-like protein isoform X1 [Zingiber officinale]
MSTLNSLFNRASLGTRCKTCLNLAISRIKLLRNKRELQLKQMHKEIAQYIQTGQEAIARIRVEYIIREQNILAAYEIIELFCEFVLARVPILEAQRDCPIELQEAVATIIFASPRCSDLPELLHLRNLFSTKYGKEFVAAASELRPESNVNRTIIEKLSVKAPPAELKIKVLKVIAQEYNLDWDSSSTEAELSKKHEDLLGGLNPTNSQGLIERSSVTSPKEGVPTSTALEDQNDRLTQSLTRQVSNTPNLSTQTSKVSSADAVSVDVANSQIEALSINEKSQSTQSSSDILERARAAIASAERASAAARAAAELVKAKLPC